MSNECQNAGIPVIEIKATKSECPMVPAGTVVITEGPILNSAQSGAVCITAMNAMYPWIMVSRFGIKATNMDWDETNQCYHVVCPCGTVNFDVKKLK